MEKLIADIVQDTVITAFMTGVKQIDRRILDAIKTCDRRKFVRPQDQTKAYEDRPLDIGYNQTISQPFIVALMIHLIEPKSTDKVLEVGSGCGYLLAILSHLCQQVYGIEVVPELAARAKQILAAEKIINVQVHCGDGNLGLLEYAPFDKIIVSAAANTLPQLLLEQLRIGGIIVLPKNLNFSEQMLIRITKTTATEFKMMDILPVRFVPLINS